MRQVGQLPRIIDIIDWVKNSCINSKKTKKLRINSKITAYVNVNNVVIKGVEQFKYVSG